MINVLFCGNDKVFDGVLTSALSILKRNETKNSFHFYVLTMDYTELNANYTSITDNKIKFLSEVVKEYNAENLVTKVDITELFKKHLKNSKNEHTSYSPYCMLRLFADLVDELPEKILYLDVDVLANRDISILYNKDITEYEYAVARDHYGKLLVYPNFMNSGVMLLNLKKIRETGLLVKARKFAMEKKFLFPDQTAIIKSTTKRMMLSQRFNDQKFLHPKTTVIRHFSKRLFWLPYPHTANVKQWHVTNVHKIFGYDQFDDVLYEYIYLKKKFEKEYNS